MDEIYEWLNPRIPVEYVLSSFLVLSVAIVIGMLVIKEVGRKGSCLSLCLWNITSWYFALP